MQTPQIEESRSRSKSASNERWVQVQKRLIEAKAQINQSIREYPLPITACDDQFNYLLEKRSRITKEIGRFNRLGMEMEEKSKGETNVGETNAGETNVGEVSQKLLAEFVASSQFVNS